MPTNLLSGNSAQFVVEFIDSSGDLVSPSSASLTITYLISGTANSSTIDLAQSGSFWTGTWSSVGVDVPSDATWSVASSATTNPAQVGTLRIIDP